MNGMWKRIFTNWRVLMLIFFLLLAYTSLNGGLIPHWFDSGVAIRNVIDNTSAANAGIPNPGAKTAPVMRERIIAVNGEKITDLDQYYRAVSNLKPNRTFKLETNKDIYTLTAPVTAEKDLGLRVSAVSSFNIHKGLDLEGGTRVLLKPTEEVSDENLDLTIDNLKERLNVYGLSDVVVRKSSDLSGNKFILIEIAGVTEGEVKELLAKQGKFEANIGNETVFYGGKKDITYVCRSADCSGIDPQQGCSQAQDGYYCRFFFAITLSQEAADRQARITDKLTLTTAEDGSSERYLSDDIALYLDDREVDRLKIGAELKGRASTNIQISGSGMGPTETEAIDTSLKNMKRLQTILITGSLPVKLETVKMDTISPALGADFLKNTIFVGLMALIVVAGVVLYRYRQAKIVLPMVLILTSEMVLILGFAALVGWNLDLAAIAAIIIVAGTGVDHLVVITDETLRGEIISDWKTRIKSAMFIIVGAYLTVLSAMIPLWFAGAGLLKGFAFTTIAGVSFGVLIARPAYAALIEQILKE